MKLSKFLKDKLFVIISFISVYIIILLMFLAFRLDNSLIIVTSILLLSLLIIILIIEYLKKYKFYNNLLENIKNLDKAYLVLETLEEPEFYEGELLYQAFYEINKSMNDKVKDLEIQVSDFKEYIEMWIHEVKIPISSLTLMNHNNKQIDKRYEEQLKKIENYVEQVLYYVRSENAHQDYLIKEIKLSKVINNIALKNKDDLLANNIDLIVNNINYKILSDAKWLEFILNQIVNNSIKYKRNINNSYLKIEAFDFSDKLILEIKDNGIGIKKEDLPKVFEKSFTGYNGRIISKSTGMGLFIVKNLCEKLGHQIKIESVQNKYTTVKIIIAKNKFYDVLK